MNIRKFTELNFDGFWTRSFDWALSFACFFYGIYANSWLWIASGLLGFLVSWYRPLGKLQRWLDSFYKKSVN